MLLSRVSIRNLSSVAADKFVLVTFQHLVRLPITNPVAHLMLATPKPPKTRMVIYMKHNG
jgi:hypothetical protein